MAIKISEAIHEYIYALDEYRAANGKGSKFDALAHKRKQERLDRAEAALRSWVTPAAPAATKGAAE